MVETAAAVVDHHIVLRSRQHSRHHPAVDSHIEVVRSVDIFVERCTSVVVVVVVVDTGSVVEDRRVVHSLLMMEQKYLLEVGRTENLCSCVTFAV